MNTFCTNSAGTDVKDTSRNECIANVIAVTPELMCREVPQAFRVGRMDVMQSAFAQSLAAYSLAESNMLAETYRRLQVAIK